MSFLPPPCPAGEECCPEYLTGFCLDDGTPISILLQDSIQTGWIDLQTGIFQGGPPPTGITRCLENDNDTEDQILCDVDDVTGDIYATVLVVRTYDAEGNPGPPVLLDPLTNDPYIPQGTVRACPADVTVNISGDIFVNQRELECDLDQVRVCGIDEPVSITGVVDVAVSGVVDIRQLDCSTDSVTVCIDDPVSITGVVDVAVTGVVDTRPLTCDDQITVCEIEAPVSITGVVNIQSQAATWSEVATSSANSSVVALRSGEVDLRHYITDLTASFDTPPVQAVLLQLKESGTVIWATFVSEPYVVSFSVPRVLAAGADVTLELAAGGIDVIGLITLQGYTL